MSQIRRSSKRLALDMIGYTTRGATERTFSASNSGTGPRSVEVRGQKGPRLLRQISRFSPTTSMPAAI